MTDRWSKSPTGKTYGQPGTKRVLNPKTGRMKNSGAVVRCGHKSGTANSRNLGLVYYVCTRVANHPGEHNRGKKAKS